MMEHFMKCINCGEKHDSDEIVYVCTKCGDLLEIQFDYNEVSKKLDESEWLKRPLNVWRYRELLPINPHSNIISLNEGGTSLQICTRLGKHLNLNHIYVKNEGENPTGSFKDRGMTVGVSKAVELGSKNVGCASTGNTSASLAAYSAKAGIRAIVFIPSGKIALGKLTQAMVHGAKIVQINGNFDDALRTMINFAKSNPKIYLLNSINPYRLEGQKTIAYELYHQLGGGIPSTIILPVGNAGNISAIWKGFVELKKLGLIKNLPRMVGIQAENASPITAAFKLKKKEVTPFSHPETVASAIRIGFPVSWKKALNAVYSSGGLMETVSDIEILEAQKLLARTEGIFVEPASAASIAGLKKIYNLNLINADETVICVTTGHGLKDPDVVISNYEQPLELDLKKELLSQILV